MFSSSRTLLLKVIELLFRAGSGLAVVGGASCAGRPGLHVGTSGFAGSDALDDREVRDEEGEAAADEAREADLSGLTGLFFCFSGEVGVIPFGESVGVPL